jgi:membrane protein DedA with SNARE-associated domain
MFNVSDPAILSHIKTVGYPLMFLIMVVEGPIATIIAAFAASLGFFNVFIVLILSIIGDITGDLILYSLGYFGGNRALLRAEKLLKVKPTIVGKVESLFNNHGKKTVFAVKSTTGLCWIAFILAGTVRMKFSDFVTASFLGGIVWSGFLVIMGYFFGYAFEEISAYIKYAGIIIFLSVVVFYVIIVAYKKHQSKQILQQ